jgi:nicotinate-nucleotide adenylyltransferase
MKIAIFGGAFNPVHNEHINIVAAAKKYLGLDKVIIMPTAISPHKSGRLSASGDDRLEMCRLAFNAMPYAEVSDYEIANGGVSYSYLTCKHFKSLYPKDEMYFLMGADMLKIFPQWKNPRDILSCVTIAACARETEDDFEKYKSNVENLFGVKTERVPYVGDKVSSTRIRTLAALGEDISQYTPPQVCQYIKEKGVYLLPDLLKVKGLLKEERWKHSVRVAIMCAENAARADLTEKQAITMGALHDCAKYMNADSSYLADFTPPDNVPKPVMHQFAGAYVAGNYFKVDDERLLSAIKYHTSGRENMSEPEKLLFLCDMLEEGRDFDGVVTLRQAFYRDLDECLYLSLKHQVEYLHSCGKEIYPLTEKAFNFIKEKHQ